MCQQANPFLQHAVSHGQVLLSEINKTGMISQDIISACDNISMAVNSGNIMSIINFTHNIRNMATQLSQSSQLLNSTVNERLDMSSYALNTMQQKLNEVAGAVQSMRGISANYQPAWRQYGTPNYGFSQPQHSSAGTFVPQ